MDFRFTDEQDMIAQTLDRALADVCTSAHLRSMVTAAQTFDAERWNILAGIGLCSALVSEDSGGLDLGEVVMCRMAESCGAALLPEPIIENAGVALPLLTELTAIKDDSTLREHVEQLTIGDGHVVLFHPCHRFAKGAANARIVILADYDGKLHIGTPDDFTLATQPATDPFAALFSCEAKSSARHIAKCDATEAAIARAVSRGSLFCAAELLGVSQAVLNLSVAYANERKQFGSAIGSNQAIKHMLAEIQVQVSFLRPVIYAAAALMDHNTAFSNAQVSHAWLRATALADSASRTAVQVHGAMGYSWETDVHLFLKRSLVLGSTWGTRKRHLEIVATRAISAGFL